MAQKREHVAAIKSDVNNLRNINENIIRTMLNVANETNKGH